MAKTIDLYLSVNRVAKRWDLSKIVISGARTTRLGKDEYDGRSRPGIETFCLLVLLTYMSRMKKPDEPDSIPEEYITSLATLHGSKRNTLHKWQQDIFGESPFEEKGDGNDSDKPVFLRAFKTNNVKHTRILRDVEVRVLMKGAPGKIHLIKIEGLKGLCHRLAKLPTAEPDRLIIEVVPRESRLISSLELSGSLTRNSRFHLRVGRNYETNLCIYWINSEKKVTSVFPHSDFKLGDDLFGELSNDQEYWIQIPKHRRIWVNSSPGTETCLVFTKEEEFTRADTEKIRQILEWMNEKREGEVCIERPDCEVLTIPKKRSSLLEKRIELEDRPDCCSEKLAQKLSGLADKLYLFDIPNR